MKTFYLSERNKFLAFIATLVCVDLIAFRNILFVGAFQSSDIGIPFYGRFQLWTSIFSGWNYQNLGQPNGYNGFILSSSFLSLITGNPAFIEKIVYYSSMPVSSILTYFFFKYWGMKGKGLWLGSMLYQFSPWLVAEFMTGEPSLTWAIALFPLYALLLLYVENTGESLKGFFYLCSFFIILVSFTLEGLDIYAFLTIPFIARLFFVQSVRSSIRTLIVWFGSAAVGMLGNLFSTGPYLSAYNAAAGLHTYQLFGGFSSIPAMQLKIWILVIIGASAITVLFKMKGMNKGDLMFSRSSVVIASLFGLLYFMIPSASTAFLYRHIFIFATFLDYDRFLLMSWLLTFLVFMLFMRDLHYTSRNAPKQAHLYAGLESIFDLSSKTKSLSRNKKKNDILGIAVSLIIGIVLITASIFASIQPYQSHTTGMNFIEGNFSFNKGQIPAQYFELRQFLLAHNATFGFGYHVLVVPQTPGNILPFSVGETMIPGYLGPSSSTNSLLKTVLSGIIQNNQNYVDVMAMAGIKYVVILPSEGDSSWPGSIGPPALSGWGGGVFPVGNASAYLNILSRWSGMKAVFRESNLTIFKNEAYSSAGITYTNYSVVSSI
ncbi:MAG: hypothetical protein JRN15_21600, partial [Nitrososphaerota archaeon]|nr:hypothetical protein [Nitrososphaerota archaeon]